MTILDAYQRRKDRRSLLKNPMSKIQWQRKIRQMRGVVKRKNNDVLSSTRRNNKEEEENLPKISATTLRCMKSEVMHLKFPCTNFAVAGALASNPSIMVLHESGEESFPAVSNNNNKNNSNNILNQLSTRFGFSFYKNKTNRRTQLRYQLIRAFNKLETGLNSTSHQNRNWEEVKKSLSTILVLPSEQEVGTLDMENRLSLLEAETTTTSSYDAVERYRRRVKTSQLREMGVGGGGSDLFLSAEEKWRQIRTITIPPKFGQEVITKKDNNNDKSSSIKSIHEIDSLLSLKLEEEYKKHDNRKSSTDLIIESLEQRRQEKEERIKQEEAEKQAKSLLRPLTEEEQDIVDDAIHGDGSPNEVIAEVGTDSVRRVSMQRLQPGEWLNDEVIHYFYVMLSKRDEELCNQSSNRSRSHFFKSFFMTKLLNEGNSDPNLDGKYEYKNVKRWSKKVAGKDLFKLDKIFFPINQQQSHWLCCIVNIAKKQIQMYDSMGARSDDLYYANYVFQYLQDEHKAKKNAPLPDLDQWELIPCSNNTPQQRNGFDCGVYTCMFADFISRDMPLLFNQQHITQCRERIALSIMNGKAII